jgi:hypothetical protein
MYIIVQHRISDKQAAFARGEKLAKNEGAPEGVRGLQFYPAGRLLRDLPVGGADGRGGQVMWMPRWAARPRISATRWNAEQAFSRQLRPAGPHL